jgi:TonB-dependent receptor
MQQVYRFLASALFVAFLLGSALTVSAQKTGFLKGVVIDPEINEPLTGAVVKVPSASRAVLTDIDGKYEMTLPAGDYMVLITYVSYATDSYKVTINANEITTLNHSMRPEGSTQATVEITATVRQNSSLGVVQEIKTMNMVANAISSDQISLSQDRNVGAIVRRIPGINIVGGQFINIRGLAERYNVVMLNDVVAPSNEADKRAFNFNSLPSSLISRIVVYKAAAPELVGDFAGGLVRIYTRGIPEKNEFSASLTFGALLGSSFRPYSMAGGGRYDLLGFDDGSRGLPKGFPDYNKLAGAGTVADRIAAGALLNNNWGRQLEYVGPDYRANINFARRLYDQKDLKIGLVASLSYSQTNTFFAVKRKVGYTSLENADRTMVDNQYSRQATTGALLNLAFQIKENHTIELKNLFNNNGTATTTNRRGVDNLQDGLFSDYISNFVQRAYYSGQLQGDHKFNPNANLSIELDWVGGVNWSNRNEPDWQFARYRDLFNGGAEELVIGPNVGLNFPSRFYFNTQEFSYTGAANLKIQPKFGRFRPTFKTGFFVDYHDRFFTSRQIVIGLDQSGSTNLGLNGSIDTLFRQQNFATNGFLIYDNSNRLQNGTNLGDYKADLLIAAGYFAAELPVTNWYKIYGGLRIESSRQRLSIDSSGKKLERANLSQVFFLPSLHNIFTFAEKHQVRLSYAMTVNRPEFRETALFTYFDFNRFITLNGNPKLKNCNIHNLDLRYEFYPNLGEVISVGGFFKYFINPIEAVKGPTQNAEFNYNNVDVAIAAGVEVEFRKKLGFFCTKANPKAAEVLDDFTFFGNFTYIYSDIRFLRSATPGLKTRGRALQGQAPYIVNVGLTYDNRKIGFSASLQYNIVGPYLTFIGGDDYPSQYEIPRGMLDLTLRQRFAKYFTVLFGIENLLNPAFQVSWDGIQPYNNNIYDGKNDPYFTKYFRGQYFTLGLQAAF